MRVKDVFYKYYYYNYYNKPIPHRIEVEINKLVPVINEKSIQRVVQNHNEMRMRVRLPTILFVVVSICLLLLLLTVFELRSLRQDHNLYHHEENIRTTVQKYIKESNQESNKELGLTYSIYGHDWEHGKYLVHVIKVLERYGYTRIELNNVTHDWDLLWAHDYPFIKYNLRRLKPHQKVNHFPGTGFITNKMDLAVTNMSHIPKAFLIPDHKNELLQYSSLHPNKLFVQKNNNHRGILIKPISELDLNSGGSFIQEYVDNPLLIDGYKFDIGLYTVITSIDPLTVYVYSGEVLFRFCPVKYHPFDPNIVDKYVVGDDYLPTWEIPSLKKYYNDLGFNMKESFDAYIRSKGKSPNNIWLQVDEAIRSICLNKESQLQNLLPAYASKHNFFEMMRFDFVIDEDLNVFVMEANMSPNLSSAHFPPNRLIYEQVLFNLFAIAGLGIPHNRMKKKLDSSMEVSIKNIVVNVDQCSSELCNSCESPDCLLCKSCLTDETLISLQKTYLQYINRRDMRRVFPPLMNKDGSFNASAGLNENTLSPENQLFVKWFRGKCKQDSAWC